MILNTTNKNQNRIIVLYFSMMLQLFLNIVASILNARLLKPEQYGNYSFLINLFWFFSIIVNAGFFMSISRLLAHMKSEQDRELRAFIAASLIVTFMISAAYCAIIFCFSFFAQYLNQSNLAKDIRILAIIGLFFPFQVYLEGVFTGLNWVKQLSYLKILPRLLYILSVIAYIQFNELTYFSAFALTLLTTYVVYIGFVSSLKPRFEKVSQHLKHIGSENLRYGFHIYLGSLSNVATDYLCLLSIGFFHNNTDLGFYNLALNISTPFLLLPGAVATVYFRQFVTLETLPRRVIYHTIFISFFLYVIFALIVDHAIRVLYTEDFTQSAALAYILGVGLAVHGFGDIVNRYLGAKGRGKEIRNGAFLTGVVNVIAFMTLVPSFSNMGAAISRTIVGITYCSAMLFFYLRTRKSYVNENVPISG